MRTNLERRVSPRGPPGCVSSSDLPRSAHRPALGIFPDWSAGDSSGSAAACDTIAAVTLVVVRGVGDVGSAVAHRLFDSGYSIVMCDGPQPTTTRRGMVFADAIFDGHATLAGVRAVRAEDVEAVRGVLSMRAAIPIYVRDLGTLLRSLESAALVDARMRKHRQPEVQIGLAKLTVGTGPNFTAGVWSMSWSSRTGAHD